MLFKFISKNQNHPLLFNHAINNHMYLVKNSKLCKTLQEKAKKHESFNTSLIEQEKPVNYFTELPIYENVDIKNMNGYDSCIFMYSRDGYTNINDIFKICSETFGICDSKTIKANKSNIIQFQYKKNDKIYIICQDPNDLHTCNWKIVRSYCIKNNIEYRNQTFPSFIKEYKNNFLLKKIKECKLHLPNDNN